MVKTRRDRLIQALLRHVRWLPRALAERVWAFDIQELRSPTHYTQLRDAPPGSSAPGQAPGKPHRDARGRFAAPPPPVLRGWQAELAAARAEAAALAPWQAVLKRARLVKRVMRSQDRAVRRAKPGRGPLHGLPQGACPGGGAVRPGGAACEDSATKPMNSGAGGGSAGARAEAPAAAVAPRGGVAIEDSAMKPMNSGAGGGAAGARAEAPAAAVVLKGGAANEGSAMKPMNSGAGGGTATADAILATLPNRAARRRWESLQRRKHPALQHLSAPPVAARGWPDQVRP